MDYTLWPQQRKMVEFASSRNCSLHHATMSSGKTLAALIWLADKPGLRLVICPKPAMGVWEEDNEKFELGLNVIEMTKGSSKDKAEQLWELINDDAIVVINYGTAKLIDLSNYGFSAVVADEAHRLGSHNSQQSLNLARSLAEVPHKMSMTGTPYSDGYKYLYGISRFLFPNTKGRVTSEVFTNWATFLNEYCHTFMAGPYTRVPRSYKNEKKLAEVVSPFTLVIDLDQEIREAKERGEELFRLPDVISREYRAPLKGEAKKAYKELAKDGITTIDDIDYVANHVLTKLIRLQQISSSGVLEDSLTGAKTELSGLENRIAVLKTLIEDIGSEPVVIFTRFERDVQLVADNLPGPAAYLTGSIDNHREWSKEKKYQYLIVNIDAGSEGVRLERARHAIFWSTGYRASSYVQAIGRIRRSNSEYDTVHISHILSKDTVDEAIYKAIKRKLDSADTLTQLIKEYGDG